MVNNGAVSRGQFGQVNTPAATEVAVPAASNAYISQNPVKQEAREQFDKDEKSNRPNQNQKKRKHKEQREQHAHAHEQQTQVHEEVVQLSRQEQRHEQRELKRQQKRQQPQESQNQQQHNNDAAHGNEAAPLPRRDRNQQRPNRPNRHRDQSVLNEAPATTEAPANPQQVKVDVVDAPRSAPMNTALIVNIDQGQSEIVALNSQQAPALIPKVDAAVVEKAETAPVVQAEKAAVAEQAPATETAQAPVKRAANDPRSRRRQRGAQAAQKAAPKVVVAPSQIPTLGQYTVSSLIRHVYGEDCTILIDQFGLITTFNRALQKFAEQYANSLVVETTVEENKRPVTRDAELPSKKVVEEAEPAPVLALTPPEAAAIRVANDPRERRRLAKMAAEQAKEAHVASNAAPAPVESTESKEEVKQAEDAVVAEAAVTTAPEQQPLELASTDAVAEIAPVEAEAVEPVVTAEVETVSETVAEVSEPTQAVEKAEQATASTEAELDDEAAKAEKEKSSRPRRPRGRPPKKATAE